MLKGFVSGEEKDIVKIPMRGKNLANLYDVDKTYLGLHYTTGDNMMIVINGTKGSGANVHTLVYPNILLHAGIYTVKVKMVSGSITNITDGLFFGINRNTYGQRTTPGVKQIGDVGERTFTLDSDTLLTSLDIAPSYASEGSIWDNATFECWLYSGSDDIPYEPYGYQNGWEIRDNQDRLIWGREDELQTTTGTLPFKGYNLPVKVKSLLGNAVQNGTPSPDNTIVPEMCGVRTGNLTPFPYSSSGVGTTEIDGITWTVAPNGAIKGTGMTTKGTNFYFQNRNHNFKLKAGTYTISIHGVHEGMNLLFRDMDASITITTIGSSMNIYTFTLDSDTGMCALYFNTGSSDISVNIDCTVMLNSGSTALPYEPYGYKIPFTNAGRTISVYLGQTQTYRAIDSVKLKDLRWEDFDLSGTTVFRMATNLPKRYGSGISTMLCTNYIVVIDRFSVTNNTIAPYNTTSSNRLIVRDDRYTTAADWVAALSDEAVVYYVLAEPEIGIVNEPLAKIGDYADELTTIQVHGLSAPLYGIGDYKDILNLATGVVTRKIKKLALTGNENWYKSNSVFYAASIIPDYLRGANQILAICSHYSSFPQTSSATNVPAGNISFSFTTTQRLYCHDTTITEVADFKTYLQQQYDAGTPVTIWYVLSTPETETVTVPTGMTGEIKGYLTQISTPTPTNQSIPKWNGEEETGGTYAVTVYTPPKIPTTTGQNTLTVDTTLAPYNTTISGHIKYTYWGKIREDVRSGLAQTKFPVGTILYDNEDATTGRAFQVVGYDKHFDPSMTARGYTHSMTLCQLKLSGPWQFDAIEAFLYTTVEMQPGTYKFKIPNYDTTYGGNKTYYFTSTVSVPVDSQIVLKWDYQKPPASVTAYAGPNPQTNTTAITGFNALQLSEWVEGESPEAIDLGTIKLADNDPDSVYGKLNHIHRARYGSNNYYQSGLRQLLNTDLTSNNWWHPTTIFDRPYANRTTNGYLRSLNEDFINVLATPEITHITNNIFEYPSLDGRTFTKSTEYKINTDKVFLLSHTEVGLSASPNIGTVLDYYSTHSTDNDRIKYRIDNGNAYHWWFRTQYPTYAYYFRLCHTSGALGSDIASGSSGVAPAHIIQ